MPLYNNILETIGNTPLIKLNKITKDIKAEIYAKVEFFNPGSSIKDRAALGMVEQGEVDGLITEDTTIVEATSGNTGIGLSLICAVKGLKLIIFMPESASIERQKIMTAYGAEVKLTPAVEGMTGAVQCAEELAKSKDHIFLTQQFKNSANPNVHRKTTALEIWNDLNKEVDVLVSSVGTGGTITGTGETLKELNPNIYIIAVEPYNSPVLSGGKPSVHQMEGMGAGFIPKVLNTEIYNEIIPITTDEAYATSRLLARLEGIFVGKSSGAALAAAILYAKKLNKKEKIVVIFADSGERYLSTDLWE
ncbi:MAG: cysteine synthase A [Candidatus Heimdallarchaeota archaeon]|nr:cysteine synthase A [Candidatus Heimdallarchaeota archaeon]